MKLIRTMNLLSCAVLMLLCFLITASLGTPTTSSATSQLKASAHTVTTGDKGNCSAVNNILLSRGITQNELKDVESDKPQKRCELVSQRSCCSYNMETKLATSSKMQLDKFTRSSILKLNAVLSVRATKFNNFFQELLKASKIDFDSMFKRTYGSMYEQHANLFRELFTDLENYYKHGKINLSDALDTFFNKLYQKMFKVMNQQYKMTDGYLTCVSENMKELRPFGDVPHKLSLQIKRSFVATRTFAQALNTSAEVALVMSQIRPPVDCVAPLTRLQQCGVCNGYPEKPCNNFCFNVMKGCLNHFHELDIEWDNFVGAMDKVAERLLGPFNIVMVVEPINIKISEAIMNFQETGTQISQQVFQGCGKLSLGRRKRALEPISPPYHSPIVNEDDDEDDDTSFVFEEDNAAEVIDAADHSISKRAAEADGAGGGGGSSNANREIQPFEPVQFSNADDDSNSSKNGRRKNKNNKNKNFNNKNTKDNDGRGYKEQDMDKLIKDIRKNVRESKKFWSNLPYQVCNLNEDLAAQPNNDMQCWNGRGIGHYPHQIVTDMQTNPEFATNPVLSDRQNSIIAGKLFILKTLISQLRTAYNGLDVEWVDQEETPEYGSGSGSGEEFDDTGSGLGPTDDIIIPRTNPTDHTSAPHEPNIVMVDPAANVTSETADDSGNKITHTGTSITDGSTISSAPSQMSLTRALFTYIFPIVMAWFGGCFSELL